MLAVAARQVDLALPNLPRGAVRPFQRFPLIFKHRFPWTDLVDDFRFEEANDALGQCIIQCPAMHVYMHERAQTGLSDLLRAGVEPAPSHGLKTNHCRVTDQAPEAVEAGQT